MVHTNRPSLSQQMKTCISQSGKTRYQIATETGIAESTLSRFVRGERTLSETSWNRLGMYFNLELVEGKPISDHERQLLALGAAAEAFSGTGKGRHQAHQRPAG